MIFSMFFLFLTFSLSYAVETKSKEIKPAAPATTSPKVQQPPAVPAIRDLEARMPVWTRRPISGETAVFIIGGRVCNVGTVDFVSPPSETAYVRLVAQHPGHPTIREVVLDSQTINRLNKGQCISINKTYEVRGVLRYHDSGSRLDPGECKDEVSFWITIGRNPKISGRTYAYDYPDANTGNNIAGRTMEYIIRCPR
jgi:hypothetical protein